MAYMASTGYGSAAGSERRNVGRVDRWVSGLIGFLALTRMGRRQGLIGKALAATSGAMLLTRATTGHSKVYDALGVSSASLDEGAGINLESAVTVNRPRKELYEFWRDVENLPSVMSHLESVERMPDGTTHWTAKGPRDIKVDWDAALLNEQPGEYLAWHSTPDSKVEHSGSVHFIDAADKGTEVHVKLRYVPPGMAVGFGIAKVLNPITQAELDEDMRRFKHMMETGVDISTQGQPVGSTSGGRP